MLRVLRLLFDWTTSRFVDMAYTSVGIVLSVTFTGEKLLRNVPKRLSSTVFGRVFKGYRLSVDLCFCAFALIQLPRFLDGGFIDRLETLKIL